MMKHIGHIGNIEEKKKAVSSCIYHNRLKGMKPLQGFKK